MRLIRVWLSSSAAILFRSILLVSFVGSSGGELLQVKPLRVHISTWLCFLDF